MTVVAGIEAGTGSAALVVEVVDMVVLVATACIFFSALVEYIAAVAAAPAEALSAAMIAIVLLDIMTGRGSKGRCGLLIY